MTAKGTGAVHLCVVKAHLVGHVIEVRPQFEPEQSVVLLQTTVEAPVVCIVIPARGAGFSRRVRIFRRKRPHRARLRGIPSDNPTIHPATAIGEFAAIGEFMAIGEFPDQ